MALSPICLNSKNINYSCKTYVVFVAQRYVHSTYHKNGFTFLPHFLLSSIRSGSGNIEEANKNPNHSRSFRVNS